MRTLRRTGRTAVLLVAAACGGDGATGALGPDADAESKVATVEVRPESLTLDALEVTRTLTATVRSVSGRELSRTVDWRSTDPAVVRVVDGTVTARVNGEAKIVASVSGVSDTTSVTVAQTVDAVSLTPGSLDLRPGASGQLTAEATDPNGRPVTDVRFAWSSDDSTVALVDSIGEVTAVDEGAATVTATAGEDPSKSETAVVTVRAVDPSRAPTLESVAAVREGERTTVTGTNFGPTPSDNTVTLDDVELVVARASATELVVEVPDLGCLPTRERRLEVATFDGSASVVVSVAADEAPLEIPVGRQTLITDPASFCLQFGPGATDGDYLVGVQSLSGAVNGLTPVQVVSVADEGEAPVDAAASVEDGTSVGRGGTRARESLDLGSAGRASSPDGPSEPGASGVLDPPGPDSRRARLVRHRAAETRIRDWERIHLDGRAGGVTAATRSATQESGSPGPLELRLSVAGGASVGDTVALRVPDVRSPNLCADWVPVDATVRAVGTRAFLLDDVSNPAGGLTAADYVDLAERIDRDVFETQVGYFGEPSDIDGNGRIVVLYTKEVNRVSDGALGFVFGGDYFPRSGSGDTCASSDEGEVVYARAPDPEGAFGRAFSREAALETAPPLMAHELTHVIQQSRRVSRGRPFMSSIVAEAQANLSEEIVGHAVTGRSPGQNLGFEAAFDPEDVAEVDWYADAFVDLAVYFGFVNQTSRVREAPDACGWWRDDPSPCRGRALWYGVGWSFLRWISDRHGPSFPGGESGLHRALIDNDELALDNVVDVVGVPLEVLMARWSAALYVDDRVAGADLDLTFTSWDFRDVFDGLVATARLQPFEERFRSWTAVGDIRASSAGYVLLEGSGGPATAVRIRDRSDGILPAAMQVWVVRLR